MFQLAPRIFQLRAFKSFCAQECGLGYSLPVPVKEQVVVRTRTTDARAAAQTHERAPTQFGNEIHRGIHLKWWQSLLSHATRQLIWKGVRPAALWGFGSCRAGDNEAETRQKRCTFALLFGCYWPHTLWKWCQS